MDVDVAVAMAFGVAGVVLSTLALFQTHRSHNAEYQARLIDRATARLEAFESISGSKDMVCIELYKREMGRRPGGYYADFRHHSREDVEVARSRLAKFWKITIQLFEDGALPVNFFDRGNWLRWGDRYRQLVEPLDVARYYRDNFFDENKREYDVAPNRPSQHRFLQERWTKIARADEVVKDSMKWCVEEEKKLRQEALCLGEDFVGRDDEDTA